MKVCLNSIGFVDSWDDIPTSRLNDPQHQYISIRKAGIERSFYVIKNKESGRLQCPYA